MTLKEAEAEIERLREVIRKNKESYRKVQESGRAWRERALVAEAQIRGYQEGAQNQSAFDRIFGKR